MPPHRLITAAEPGCTGSTPFSWDGRSPEPTSTLRQGGSHPRLRACRREATYGATHRAPPRTRPSSKDATTTFTTHPIDVDRPDALRSNTIQVTQCYRACKRPASFASSYPYGAQALQKGRKAMRIRLRVAKESKKREVWLGSLVYSQPVGGRTALKGAR